MSGRWLTSAGPACVMEGRVDVWRVNLSPRGAFAGDALARLLDSSYAVLDAEETARAARMRVAGAREEFVVGRGCLRRLLGAQLDAPASEVALVAGEHGKPALQEQRGLDFNVAHSCGMVLIALSRAGAVGVDVEGVDKAVEVLDVARTAFHPADVARLERAPSEEARRVQFFRHWTLKEALGKADGRGLGLPAMDLGECGGGERRVRVDATQYFVRELEVGLGHIAALATVHYGMQWRCFDLRPETARAIGP